MSRRPLIHDPATKYKQVIHQSPADDSVYLESTQDVEDVAEINKAKYNSLDERAPWRDGMNHVASIPLVVYEELLRKGIAQDNKRLLRWLDDPNNRLWRTRPGKLSK